MIIIDIPNVHLSTLQHNYQLHFPGKTEPLSKEETKEIMKAYNTGLPDMKMNFENQIAEGDLVVSRFNLSGTNKGEFQGIPASNKKVTVTATSIHRIVDGKIVEE